VVKRRPAETRVVEHRRREGSVSTAEYQFIEGTRGAKFKLNNGARKWRSKLNKFCSTRGQRPHKFSREISVCAKKSFPREMRDSRTKKRVDGKVYSLALEARG
jgi:hypothetical protein